MPRLFHKSLTVGPESIDAVGHVNNREYLRWMEEVAVGHSTAQGWPMGRYFARRTAWGAISHYIEYLRPALAGELIDIHTWVANWNLRDSTRRYAVMRERKLLATLDPEERKQLETIIDKLANAGLPAMLE